VKTILKRHPKAGGVGYVIAPQLIKIANEVGLFGYDRALIDWNNCGVINETVSQPGESVVDKRFSISWEGPALSLFSAGVKVGLEETIHQIELKLDEMNKGIDVASKAQAGS